MLAYLTSLLSFKYASCGLVSFMHMKFFRKFLRIFYYEKKSIDFFGKILTKQRKKNKSVSY